MADQIAKIEAEAIAQEPYDANDRTSVNNARKKAARREKSHLTVVRNIMLNEAGRAWMYDRLEACKIFGNPIIMVEGRGADTHSTFFELGQQNVGKLLLQDVQSAAPAEYLAMLRENQSSRR